MESSNSLCIKSEILERLTKSLHAPHRDKNLSGKVFWSIGFSQDPNICLSFATTRKEFDLILAGSILKADKFESEYKATLPLLPFGMTITGLLVVIESVMDEKVLASTSARIAKELKKFTNSSLPNPYYLIFIRKLPAETVFFTTKDVVSYRIKVPRIRDHLFE